MEQLNPSASASLEAGTVELEGFVFPRAEAHGGKVPRRHPVYECLLAEEFAQFCKTALVPVGTRVQTTEGQIFEIEVDSGRFHESALRFQPKASQRSFCVGAVFAAMIPREFMELAGSCFDLYEARYIVSMHRAGFVPVPLGAEKGRLTAKEESKRVSARLASFMAEVRALEAERQADPRPRSPEERVRADRIAEVISLEKNRMKDLAQRSPSKSRKAASAPALESRVKAESQQLLNPPAQTEGQLKYECGYLSHALKGASEKVKASLFDKFLDFMDAEARSLGASMNRTGQVRFGMSCDVQTNFHVLFSQVDSGAIQLDDMRRNLRVEPVVFIGPSGHRFSLAPEA